jgi:O-antigen/teichoic acid export membrane protein
VLRQAFIYMIAHAISAILGLCSVIIFTRLLSPAEYGFYIICMSISGVVSALLFAWVKISVLRFESEGGGTDIRLTALAGLLLSMATSPVVVLVTVLATGEDVLTAMVAVGLAMTLAAFEFGQEILRARQRSNAYGLSAVTRAVLALVLSLLLVWSGFAGLGLVLGVAGAYLFTSLLFAGFVWQRPLSGFNPAVFQQMLTFGVPMAISGIVFSLHSAMDRLIIVYYLGEGAAGVYGASADLVRQIVLFPATAVAAAVIPVAIKAFAEGGSVTAKQQMGRSGELLLAVLAPTVVGLALVSSHVSGIILGPEFREAATYLMPVLSFVWMFQVFTQQFVHVSFHMAKLPRLLAIQGSIVLVINAALMFALVPRYGLLGAAWALLLAEASGVAIGYVLALRAQPLPLLAKPIVKVAAATVAMAVPTAFVLFRVDGLIGLGAAVAIGMIIYAAAAVLLDIADVRKAMASRFGRVDEAAGDA